MNSISKVFVTGGSGYLGRNLIKYLVNKGCSVNAIARSASAAEAVKNAGATAFDGDLHNLTALSQGIEGCDVVIHAAASVSQWEKAGASMTREDVMKTDAYRDNVIGTSNVIKAAQEAGVRKFVHVSTEAVLVNGNPIVDVDETFPRPADAYGLYPITKGMAEEVVQAANHVPNETFETVIVRPRLIWGADDTTVLKKMVEAVGSGSFSWINGGRFLTSTCHVYNVCEGCYLAAQRGRGGEIYFLTDGRNSEFRSFMGELFSTQGIDANSIKKVPLWAAKIAAYSAESAWKYLPLGGEPPLCYPVVYLFGQQVTVNDTKARTELGYTSHFTIEQGMDELRSMGPQFRA